MIDAGIVDGDFVVVRQQPEAEQGDIVVAGIPDERGDGQAFSANGRHGRPHPGQRAPGAHGVRPGEITIYGKVVTVLRRL